MTEESQKGQAIKKPSPGLRAFGALRLRMTKCSNCCFALLFYHAFRIFQPIPPSFTKFFPNTQIVLYKPFFVWYILVENNNYYQQGGK